MMTSYDRVGGCRTATLRGVDARQWTRALECPVALACRWPRGARPAAGGPVVEADPLRCWWRTDRASIRMGEPFEAVLTCAALETASTKVVVDRSRLDPTVMALPPFDVLGGAAAEDATHRRRAASSSTPTSCGC